MLPEDWKDWQEATTNSYQYITQKIKLFFTFETVVEEAIMQTLVELMNFPKLDDEYFPTHYFVVLLRHLTDEQITFLE